MVEKVRDFIGGQWVEAPDAEWLNVINPASADVIGHVLLTPREIVAQAVETGHKAFQEWRSHHGIEFYTQTKVVVERWPREWNRQF
jgi:acyl-CoA reductase-like NAD-dependent aldehyde dehydrogenase